MPTRGSAGCDVGVCAVAASVDGSHDPDLAPATGAWRARGSPRIFLPDDYAPAVARLFYSEQYALATYLLAPGADIEILLPATYVSRAPQYRSALDDLWDRIGLAEVQRDGSLFWFLSPG